MFLIKRNNKIFKKISLYFGFILPYVLLIAINLWIIYIATKFERTQKNVVSCLSTASHVESRSARKKAQMTRSILFITFLYIVVTIPSTLVSAFFFDSLQAIDIGFLVLDLVDMLHFSYPAFNFFILFFSNKLFAKEFRKVFKSNQVSFSDTNSYLN